MVTEVMTKENSEETSVRATIATFDHSPQVRRPFSRHCSEVHPFADNVSTKAKTVKVLRALRSIERVM